MDHGFATVNTHQPTSKIPPQIYQSLYDIALQGCDAQKVSFWYQSILRDLHRDNFQPPSADPNISADDDLNAQYKNFLDADCAARRATQATIDSCLSQPNNLHAIPSTELPSTDGDYNQAGTMYTVSTQDSMSQAYNTPQSYQAYTTTPQKLDTTPEPSQNPTVVTGWSPAPSSVAEQDLYALSAPGAMSNNNNLLAFAGEPSNAPPSYPWFSSQDLGSLHTRNHSQNSQLSQLSLPASAQQLSQLPLQQQQQQQPQQPYLTPEYNPQLSSMPVLVPYASSGGGGNYTKAAAIPTGPGASLYQSGTNFFPIIHVSSSRRRRKALQKGVKKMVQPLKGRRQQSV